MPIGNTVKFTRNHNYNYLYDNINKIYSNGRTLDEACGTFKITRQHYYYLCKIINREYICQIKTTRNKNKQRGGYTDIAFIDNTGTEINRVSLDENNSHLNNNINKLNKISEEQDSIKSENKKNTRHIENKYKKNSESLMNDSERNVDSNIFIKSTTILNNSDVFSDTEQKKKAKQIDYINNLYEEKVLKKK